MGKEDLKIEGNKETGIDEGLKGNVLGQEEGKEKSQDIFVKYRKLADEASKLHTRGFELRDEYRKNFFGQNPAKDALGEELKVELDKVNEKKYELEKKMVELQDSIPGDFETKDKLQNIYKANRSH